jgi:hypothetical protein
MSRRRRQRGRRGALPSAPPLRSFDPSILRSFDPSDPSTLRSKRACARVRSPGRTSCPFSVPAPAGPDTAGTAALPIPARVQISGSGQSLKVGTRQLILSVGLGAGKRKDRRVFGRGRRGLPQQGGVWYSGNPFHPGSDEPASSRGAPRRCTRRPIHRDRGEETLGGIGRPAWAEHTPEVKG